jgi:hypothetical protein
VSELIEPVGVKGSRTPWVGAALYARGGEERLRAALHCAWHLCATRRTLAQPVRTLFATLITVGSARSRGARTGWTRCSRRSEWPSSLPSLRVGGGRAHSGLRWPRLWRGFLYARRIAGARSVGGYPRERGFCGVPTAASARASRAVRSDQTKLARCSLHGGALLPAAVDTGRSLLGSDNQPPRRRHNRSAPRAIVFVGDSVTSPSRPGRAHRT